MNANIFREYDIRGVVGKDLLLDQAYDLGRAIATKFKKLHPEETEIIIGYDGRTHSPKLRDAITQACQDSGFDVLDVGLVPTPVLYFASHYLKKPCALEITASHNPKEYNGIKMCGIWGKQIKEIYQFFSTQAFIAKAEQPGSVKSYDALTDYIEYLAEHFKHLKGLTLDTVIDCGNGPAGLVYPRLIEKMGWKNVKLLFVEVDGTFPNHEADPTVPENMTFVKDELSNAALKFGLGLDGDCDRMTPMTKAGTLVPGDKLLALFAQSTLKDHPGATVVCDIKSSSSLLEVLELWGARPHLSPSGHSLIKEAMIKEGALLAGELSCHFFFKDRYFGYDDGIYASLRLFELLITSGKSLEQLLEVFPRKASSPEFRISCESDEDKHRIIAAVKISFKDRTDADLITIDGIRAQMAYGWGLVRASNTQPAISMRFESTTPEGLIHVKEDFFSALKPYFDDEQLRKQIEL